MFSSTVVVKNAVIYSIIVPHIHPQSQVLLFNKASKLAQKYGLSIKIQIWAKNKQVFCPKQWMQIYGHKRW